MNIGVILSGGGGVRFGSDLPKQYNLLNGKEVIAYVVDTLEQSESTDLTLIVSAAPLTYKAEYAKGGKTHNESVKSAIDYISEHYPNCKNVLFLDAARPFVSAETVDKYFDLLNGADVVITTQHITDSLGKDGEQFIDRSNYYLIQKPEAFRFEMLQKCFSAASETTAIVQQMPDGAIIEKYFGAGLNMKITYPEDLIIAERLMKQRGGGR